METKIKAIETEYDGHLFRSRLEARWAVFFKTLGIPYEYENEGFILGDGIKYLPDFWLPKQKVWIEIKGAHPSDGEQDKCHRLAMASGFPVFLFFGDIPYPDPNGEESAFVYEFYEVNGVGTKTWDNGQYWCECLDCGLLGIEFNGRADRLPCICPVSTHGDKGYSYDSPRLVAAYALARKMRF